MAKKSVWLAHWREDEGLGRKAELEAMGFSVEYLPVDAGKLLGVLKANPPRALVIDLTRSPSQGRDLAVALRVHGGTRSVPLLFVEGAPEKVARVKEVLPDATFTNWHHARRELERVLAEPVRDPVVPDSALAGYSGTPLPKKLGIKPGHRVLLSGAPAGFEDTLVGFPKGVSLSRRYSSKVDIILWFVRRETALRAGIGEWASRTGREGIWIVWPKKSSGVASDLNQATVRREGLAHGLVDYKIAAIDPTWSGLKFAVRKR